MKLDDIVALAKAGYTAEQISKMAALEANPDPRPVSEPAPEPAPEPQNPPAQDPKPDPMEAMLTQLSQLTAAIQANGILGSTQPKQPTADDILASIIAPPRKE